MRAVGVVVTVYAALLSKATLTCLAAGAKGMTLREPARHAADKGAADEEGESRREKGSCAVGECVDREEVGLLQRLRAGGRGDAEPDGEENEAGQENATQPTDEQLLLAVKLRELPGWRMPGAAGERSRTGFDDGPRPRECRTQPDGTGCPLSDMVPGEVYRVFPGPGRHTACLRVSEAFYFQVRRGDPQKLLFQFQGGGICWTSWTVNMFVCEESPSPMRWSGIYNASEPANPYKDWSVVLVMSCSGDLFSGDTEQPWQSVSPTQIRGYNNANATLEWALAQFPKLSRLTLGGFSTGALASQMWADTLLQSFAGRGAETTVLLDSFVGVMWPAVRQQTGENNFHQAWFVCDTPLLTPAEALQCREGRFLLSDHFAAAIRRHPETRFVMINSKHDAVQIAFERLFESTLGNTEGAEMRDDQFYAAMNLRLQRYAREPNFFSYFAQGDHHAITGLPALFEAAPQAPSGGGGPQKLIDWIADRDAKPRLFCSGAPKHVAEGDYPTDGVDYCDVKLLGG